MCGIFGRVNLKGKPVVGSDLTRMSQALYHRGPDDQQWKIFASFGFGVNRLSIIDVIGGQQPLANEDKTIWAIQNGEIYNYRELARSLKNQGHSLKTQSDTEVLVHLYEEKGVEFVKELSGMFALAIWDNKKKRLILARDRLGIKPLYYTYQQDCFLFASELKALLTQDMARSIRPQALWDFLSLNYIPGPETVFDSVFKLPPGTMLVYENGKAAISPFWQLHTYFKDLQKVPREQELVDKLTHKLDRAVQSHLVSDVPIGVFLSGGLDSSAVVAFASKHQKNLKTFSVGFKEKTYDELRFASQIAKHFGTDHVDLTISLDVPTLVEKMASFWDEPFADSSAIPTFAISAAAYGKVKVILTGDGGDEVFGGYEIYKADRLLDSYRHLPQSLRILLGKIISRILPVSHEKMSLDLKIRRFIRGSLADPVEAHFLWRAIFTESEKTSLLKNRQKIRPSSRLFKDAVEEVATDDSLNKLLYLDTRMSLVGDMLTKVDRMSMANSLEVRVPLLDHNLVEFMAGLPSSYKVRKLHLKYLLKKTLAGILPSNIINRPKAGFHAPVPHWIKYELKEMIHDYLSASTLRSYGDFFNPRYVQKILKEHEEEKADWSRNIWGLLMWQLWYERYAKTN